MHLRWPWLLSPLSVVAGCGLLGEADVSALPRIEAGVDAADVTDRGEVTDGADAADASDVPDADAGDGAGMDRPNAPDVTDVTDILDATDARDATDVTDILDAADALDGRDGGDAMDVRDASDAADADAPLPLCPRVTRLLAPPSNSVATGPLVRFSWEGAAGVARYRVTMCESRGCVGGRTPWSQEVNTATEPAVANTVVLPRDASLLPPGVYWWSVTTLGTGCAPVTSDPRELRIGVTPPMSTGNANWWGAYADFNSDGYADLAVGDPASSRSVPGTTHVHLGSSAGLPVRPSRTIDRTAPGFGTSVASAGDFNGDGYGDLVAATNGGARVFRGGPSGIEDGEVSLAGMPTEAVDVHVVGVGDVNGDGFGDVVGRANVVGVPHVYYAAGSRGAVSFVEVPTLLDAMVRPCRLFGASVAPAGDVNGDHFADFVVGCPARVPGEFGAPMAPARAFVVLGGAGFSPRAPRFVALQPPAGMDAGSTFGHLVAGVGNVTGTLRTVVAVGNEDAMGHLHLFEFGDGGTPMPAVVPLPMGLPMALPPLGALRPLTAMVGLGDVNRDGIGDFLLSFGELALPFVILVPSHHPPTRFTLPLLVDPNVTLAGAGDFDADGFDDFVVGSRHVTGGGRVQVFPGASSYPSPLAPPIGAPALFAPPGRTLYAASLAAGR